MQSQTYILNINKALQVHVQEHWSCCDTLKTIQLECLDKKNILRSLVSTTVNRNIGLSPLTNWLKWEEK